MQLRGSWLALLCIPLLAALITNDLQQQPTTTDSVRSLADAGSAGGAEVSPLLPLQPGSVVAVADLHGDLPKAHAALQLLQLVDQEHNWEAQGVTLVQLGDLVDRGPHSLQLLQLFQRLKAQSPSASSQVELLLGNHELMLLQQDLRYFSRQELQHMGEQGGAAAGGAAEAGAAASEVVVNREAQQTAVEDGSRDKGEGQQAAQGGAATQTHVSNGRSMQQQQQEQEQRLNEHPPPQQQQQQQEARPPPPAELVEGQQHQEQPLGPHHTPSSSSSSSSSSSGSRPQECAHDRQTAAVGMGQDHSTAATNRHGAAGGSDQPSELRRLHQRRLLHVTSSDASSIRPPALTLPEPRGAPPGTPLLTVTRHQRHHQQHELTEILIRFDNSSTGNGSMTSTMPPSSSSSHKRVAASPTYTRRAQARHMAALTQRSILTPPPRQLRNQQDAVLAGFAVLGDLLKPTTGSLWQQLVQRQLVAVAGQGGCATAFVHAGLTITALEHLLAHAPPPPQQQQQQQAAVQRHQQPHKQLAASGTHQQQQQQHDRQLEEQAGDGPEQSPPAQRLGGVQIAAWLNAAAQQALASCTPHTCSTAISSGASRGTPAAPRRQHTRGGPAPFPTTSLSDTPDAPTTASTAQPLAAPAALLATQTGAEEAADHLSEQQLASFWAAMTHGKGPVWNRMLATAAEALVCPEVAQVCRVLGVHRLVVGHTPQASGRATVRCRGHLLLLDTGMSIGIYNSTPAGFVCTPGTAPVERHWRLATESASDGHRQLQQQQKQQEEEEGRPSSSCRAAVLYGDGVQQDLPCDSGDSRA